MIARPDGAQLTLPQGFNIDVFAEGFQRPRFMLEGPGKEILLSDSVTNGSVWVLQDKDRTSKASRRKKSSRGWTGLSDWRCGRTIYM